MCVPETLHHNEHGYVSWCAQCRYLNLAFGNMMVAFNTPQAEGFLKVLAVDAAQYEGRICVNEKAFVYNSDSRHVKFVLNYKEVQNLMELLNKALLMHHVKELISGVDPHTTPDS
jgi:hypothetical protein